MLQPGIFSAQQARGRGTATGQVPLRLFHIAFSSFKEELFSISVNQPYPSPLSSSSCCQKQEAGKTGTCGMRGSTGSQDHSSRAITVGMWAMRLPLIALFKQKEGSILGYPMPQGAHCSLDIQLPGSRARGEQEHWREFCDE